MSDQEILFDVRGSVGRVHLNMPKTFNSLTRDMCQAFRAQLLAWQTDDAVQAVVVTGEGDRAFCAGGDIRALYDAARTNPGAGMPFFWDEYRLDTAVHHFSKPYVALMDGIVMGGGVGVSVHGSHRVLTERTMFAMPETGIGLFPDVGASWFLPRLPGGMGRYLGLTGARLKAADTIHVGLGTHFVASDKLDAVIDTLAASDFAGDAAATVNTVLERFTSDPGPAQLVDHQPVIDSSFAQDSVEEIVAALRAEDGYFAIETADTIDDKCPTSLKVTFEQLRRGASMDYDDAIRMEYRMVAEMLHRPDFFEGIRAAVVDKDRSPKWQPDTLDAVTEEAVEAHFRPTQYGELSFD